MDDQVVIFWTGFKPLIRIVLVSLVTYIGVTILMKHAGKRTLASMNALDFIITVAIGSAFGRILTAQQVSISEAMTAFCMLVFIKMGIAQIELKFRKFAKFITPQPTLLFYNGKFFDSKLKKERIHKNDLYSELRKKSVNSFDQVEAIILESSGQFSILTKSENNKSDTLKGLF